MATVEEVKGTMIANDAYFAYNGRVLKLEEVNGLKHDVIVHAARKMHGGEKRRKQRRSRILR